ncbi:MAG TPA: NAD(P)/FAD-dependent oxidoreductase [archaeon]|nr:NAD(P)/FAD-dependent oxidoreductase [archaeon]
MNPIAIIGAGPAGLSTAIKLREEGFDSIVYEEHEKIGYPEHCSGLISKKGIDELRLNLGDSLQNTIYGAKIYSPNGTMLKVQKKHPVAYVVNRAEFDSMLLRKARLLGIHVSTHTKLIDARKSINGNEKTLFIQVDGRGEMRKTNYIIGSDGVNSTVRHLMGINTEKEKLIHTIQATCTGEFDERYVEVHFGDYAKGFFAWVVPISKDKAKIGLGNILGENISENFKEFLKTKYPSVHVKEKVSALIPYGEPLKELVKDNFVLVGDAAFQTKATTGGGVIFGMKAGNILGEVIANMMKKKGNLKDYEKKLTTINKELQLHWKIRKYINSLSNEEMDKLFLKLKEKNIEHFLEEHGDMDQPSKFIGKLMSNPKYWTLFGTAMKFLRT